MTVSDGRGRSMGDNLLPCVLMRKFRIFHVVFNADAVAPGICHLVFPAFAMAWVSWLNYISHEAMQFSHSQNASPVLVGGAILVSYGMGI